MFRSESWAAVRDGHAHGIEYLGAISAPVDRRHLFGAAPFPKVRFGAHRDAAPRGGMFQGVIQKVGDGLLDFLVIELESWEALIKQHFQPHVLALKSLLPAGGQLGHAISQIVFAEMQHELSAFQS